MKRSTVLVAVVLTAVLGAQTSESIDSAAIAKIRDEAQQHFDNVRTAPLREAGVLCRAQLIEDPDAIGVLRRVAREVEADLVVVGSHGRTGWRERILGNVATKLPHALDCPITIVPAPKVPRA